MAQENKVQKIIAPYSAFITYVPLRTEVPFLDYIDIPAGTTLMEIPPRASLNPAEEAKKAMAIVGDKPTAILMPGRSFDSTGTRHGQGGGWYDRFLALVPREWFRIGFCYEKQFSVSPLVRQEWDQAMDAVCVVKNDGMVAVYEAEKV